MSKGQKIVMWVATVLLTALFLSAGLPKLLMPEKMLDKWIYARWFLTVVGVCETLGAIGLLIRQLAVLAALGLCGILIGVFYTLIHIHMYSQLPVPIVAFILLIVVINLRRKEGRTVSAAAVS